MEDSNEQPAPGTGASAETSTVAPAGKTLEALAGLSYRAGELQQYLDSTCASMVDLLGDGLVAVTLYRNGKKDVLAQVPPPSEPISPSESIPPLDVHGPIAEYVVQTGETLCVEDTDQEVRYGSSPEGYHSYLGVPLRLPKGEVVGTICYFDSKTRHFRDSEVQTAQLFAERVAIALDNYDLYQDLKQHSTQLEELVQDRTSQLLAARDELAHKEKLAAVGEFATRLTHEIRNPLTTIRLALEYLQQNTTDGSHKRAKLAGNEVSRLERMLNEVLMYTKPAQATPRPVELDNFCADFILTNESLAHAQDLTLQLVIEKPATVMADADKLTQIFLNLTRNACDAGTTGQAIVCSTGVDGDDGFVRIHNCGAIIPPDKLSVITDAFVSGKPNSSGLGLAIVKSLVDVQQGRLSIASNAKGGTTFTVYLPLLKDGRTQQVKEVNNLPGTGTPY